MKASNLENSDEPARILIVDDEIWIREFLKDVLVAQGYTIDTAAGENSALKAMEAADYDLVVTDLMMGEFSGYEVLEHARQLPGHPEVVVMTGDPNKEHATRALKFGAFDYLSKPIESERLHLTIQRALEHRRLKTEVARLSGNNPSVRARVFEGALGFYDSVTGLPNRTLLFDRLDQSILRRHNQDGATALIVIGVDQYREVGLVDGVQKADALLVRVAEHLRQLLFSRDTLARTGGDEFTIVAELDTPDSVMSILAKLHDLQIDSDEAGDWELVPTLSSGVALCPADGNGAQQLYSRALNALDVQQRKGGNGYQFYQFSQDKAIRHQITVERRLARAVEAGNLQVFMQPYHRFANGAPHGGEALLRWISNGEAVASPSEFVPMLERNRLIVPVTEHLVSELARIQGRIISAGIEEYHLSFNVSPLHLERFDEAQRLVTIMVDQLPDISRVVVELTEGIFLSDSHVTTQILDLFREAGVATALDDFGTGYSSLSYLTRRHFDYLKVDRSFVNQMSKSSDDLTIVSAILSLAHQLGMATIAEGVETEDEAETLRRMGCDLAQGYLYSRPLPADDVIDHFLYYDDVADLVPLLEEA